MSFDGIAAVRVLIGLLGGLALGLERQWSGHATGPHAHLGGLRTFTMLGLIAGLSGWLWSAGLTVPSGILLAASAAVIAIGYARASQFDIDATTEVAGLVVLTAGVLSGLGQIQLAMGVVAVTLFFLAEKTRLHRWASKLDGTGVLAGARFAVMALVVLPLLPTGPYGPYEAIRPRELWALVLFFSGLSFASYVARRTIGTEQGFAVSGILGGFISSTSVTLTMSRLSQSARAAEGALASGVMGANAMLFLRVLAATGVLAPALTKALWPAFVAPFLIAAALTVLGMRTHAAGPSHEPDEKNPLEFRAALQMAALFQVVIFVMAALKDAISTTGLLGSAAVLGLTDVDALTMSISRAVTSGTPVALAATAIAIGILANTLVKLGLVIGLGRGKYRLRAGAGLLLIAGALATWVVRQS
ncbi:MAG: MgtC/SapB family protein [Acidobacteria bacterium]|nr:MAG: MgtC/SapB family protein [Acidobacteriota bacterium]